jgi:hypothetical protein
MAILRQYAISPAAVAENQLQAASPAKDGRAAAH